MADVVVVSVLLVAVFVVDVAVAVLLTVVEVVPVFVSVTVSVADLLVTVETVAVVEMLHALHKDGHCSRIDIIESQSEAGSGAHEGASSTVGPCSLHRSVVVEVVSVREVSVAVAVLEV